MQQDNIIQQHLRNIDDQQEPDLRHQEAHWQQMAQMLGAPAMVPKHKPAVIRYLFGGLGLLLGIVALLKWSGTSSSYTNAEPPTFSPSNKVSAIASSASLAGIADSGKTTTQPVAIQKEVIQYAQFTDDELFNAAVAADLPALKINYTPCASCPGNLQDSTKTIGSSQRQLQLFFASLAKPSTAFLVNNQRDTILTAPEGTQLEVPAGSLDSSENILIEIREYYRNSDIILNQLHSRSNKAQLITAGMVNITAMVDGKYMDVKAGRQLRLCIPGIPSEMQQMQLFQGETNANEVNQDEREDESQNFINVKEALNWIPQPDTFKPVSIWRDTTGKGKVYAYFRSGKSDNEWMVGQPPQVFNNPAALVLKSNVIGSRTNQSFLPNGRKQAEGIPKEIGVVNDSFFMKRKEKYGVELSRLGWISCNRLYKDALPKIKYEVHLPGPSSQYYGILIFQDFQSIMPAQRLGNNLIFDQVPLGEAVNFICFGIDANGAMVCCITKAVTSQKGLADLNFELYSEATLKSSLSKMDR